MELIVTVFLGIISAACLLYGWYFIQQTKLKERILLAEKGIDIKTLVPPKKFKNNLWLRIGIVVISSSTGFMLGLFTYLFKLVEDADAAIFAYLFSFLFGGIGMVIAHYVDKPKEQN